MDVVQLKFVEHDKRSACSLCIFRATVDGYGDNPCHWDHTEANEPRIQCRAAHASLMPVGRDDGRDGYWTLA
jgi:hypothetical protein